MATHHSRREFFARLTALGIAGVAGSGIDFSEQIAANDGLRLDQLRPEDFAKHVGQTFIITDGSRRLQAELIKVNPHRSGGGDQGERTQFSVIFRVPGSEPMPHRTYSVEHALMGRLDLFLGSVGAPVESCAHLEAVFA